LYYKLYDTFISIILILPIIFFIIAAVNANHFKNSNSCDNKDSYITIIIIIALPFMAWFNERFDQFEEKKKTISHLIILTVILALISLFPICTNPDGLYIWNHCRKIFEIMAITLFIYVLLQFYTMG